MKIYHRLKMHLRLEPILLPSGATVAIVGCVNTAVDVFNMLGCLY